ncbi:MAG: DUF1045 domain-containing protein [Burkholderiales bacterium]
MTAGPTTRYAVYFSPPSDSQWWRFGSRFLGRDAITGARLAHPAVAGLAAREISLITKKPRQYGFHATLKAPFRLACSPADFFRRAETIAADCKALALPPLRLTVLDAFIALTPSARMPEIEELAAKCAVEFDDLRAPASVQEIEKRRVCGLTRRQDEQLRKWGYPFVFDDFRFHFTLTGRLRETDRRRVIAALEPVISGINREPLRVDAFTLFAQDADSPFVAHRRCHFDGTVEVYRRIEARDQCQN